MVEIKSEEERINDLKRQLSELESKNKSIIIEEEEEPEDETPKRGLFRRKNKQFNKKKMKVKARRFNTIVCHFLEETSRGDMLKINEKNLKLKRDAKNNSSYVKVQRGTNVYVQTNEMLLRADGTKETFILRTGSGTFKALSLQYLSENYFREHSDEDVEEFVKTEKSHALYMRSMNINERQVFMDTAKKIVENSEQGWEKVAPWAALIIIAVIMIGGFYMISDKMAAGQTAVANKNYQASALITTHLDNLTTQLLNGIQVIKSNSNTKVSSGG